MTTKTKKLTLNKILFEKKINNIKNSYWRNYWLSFFKLKTILLKILCFLVIGGFVLGLSFGIRDLMLNNYSNKVHLNKGVSFSLFENMSETGIRLIQIFPVIGLFIAFLFVNDWYIFISIPFAIFGGLSNFIDRFIVDKLVYSNGQIDYGYNTVVDYINGGSSVFNVPDIFIVFGISCLLIGIVAKIIISTLREDKEKNKSTQDIQEINSLNNINNNEEPITDYKNKEIIEK